MKISPLPSRSSASSENSGSSVSSKDPSPDPKIGLAGQPSRSTSMELSLDQVRPTEVVAEVHLEGCGVLCCDLLSMIGSAFKSCYTYCCSSSRAPRIDEQPPPTVPPSLEDDS